MYAKISPRPTEEAAALLAQLKVDAANAIDNAAGEATHPDGVTWTCQSGLSSTAWGTAFARALTWNRSVFVAVGDSGKCATSPDGTTWTYP